MSLWGLFVGFVLHFVFVLCLNFPKAAHPSMWLTSMLAELHFSPPLPSVSSPTRLACLGIFLLNIYKIIFELLFESILEIILLLRLRTPRKVIDFPSIIQQTRKAAPAPKFSITITALLSQ